MVQDLWDIRIRFKNKGGDFGLSQNQVKTRLARISAYIF